MSNEDLKSFLNSRVPSANNPLMAQQTLGAATPQQCPYVNSNASADISTVDTSERKRKRSNSLHQFLSTHSLPQSIIDSIDSSDPCNHSSLKSAHQTSKLFPLLLETIWKHTAASSLSSSSSSDPSNQVPSASELIQAIAMELKRTSPPALTSSKGILRAQELPASVESNAAIYASLLFLSQPIKFSKDVQNLFPSMPLLLMKKSEKDTHTHPTSFSCSHFVTLETFSNPEFHAKLQFLEQVFWSSSSVAFSSRCHDVPRFETSDLEVEFVYTGKVPKKGRPEKEQEALKSMDKTS